ncbi:murein biosynthesis integral membrane protein MurJ [Chondromyces apiculatus]|uniref:murein biosynthesis integral membrane protein MurJ n=1 Tax=Chondromyces apiculatus TaxID=51 RepID=UPI001E4E02DC|nr:murein biosynthesis integral membrane protein MurJ [Chondromyces apiculatus]
MREPAEKAPKVEAPAVKAPSGGRSAALVTAGILLSRLAGLLRQRVMAHYFGAGALADVIAAAFRIGNITQNLLGEGTLSASFIPVYAKLRGGGRGREAARFAWSSLWLLALGVGAVSVLGVLFAPWLSALLAAGFDADRLARTTQIVRVVFPMTGLLVLSAWGLGVLNAHRRFFLPYAAPVVWSAAQIAALWALGGRLGWRGEALAEALAWSALVGAALQLGLLLPAARRLLAEVGAGSGTGVGAGSSVEAGADAVGADARAGGLGLGDPNVREAVRRLPGALLGRGAIQISGLLDTLLVSFLGTGANAAFGYAQTVYLLPMSLLGTGEAAASLPEMAADTAEADRARRNAAIQARLGASLGRLTVLSLPATAALVGLGPELITLLFQTGSFDREATARVAPLVAAYGIALLGNASGRVLGATCFALGDTRTPARLAVVRVVVSTVLSVALMQRLSVLGVVLGAVIAGWVEAILLGRRVRAEVGGLGLRAVRLGRVLALTAVSLGAGLGARAALPEGLTGKPLGALLVLGAFGGAFVVAAPALGLLNVRSLLRRR